MSVTTSSLTRYSDGSSSSSTRHQSRKYRSAPRSVTSSTSSLSADRDYETQAYAQRAPSNVGSTTSSTARSARLAAAAQGMPPPDYFTSGASRRDAMKFYESRREYEAEESVAGAGRGATERGYSSGARSYAGRRYGGDQYHEDDRRDRRIKDRKYEDRGRSGYDDDDEDDRYTISPSDSASQVSYASSAPSKALQLRRRDSAVGGGYTTASRACPWEAEWRARNPNYGADERPYYDEGNECWIVDVRPGGD